MDLSERAQSCHDYIHALEEERKKIQVFQRELPLSLQLVTQAIESVRHQMSGGSDETMSDAPVLEEFLPLRPSSSSSEDGNHIREDKKSTVTTVSAASVLDKKPDWLRSVQLWNQQEPSPVTSMEPPKKPVAVNAKKIGGAFQPFEREKHVPAPAASSVAIPAASSTTSGGGLGGGLGGGGKDEKDKEKEDQSQAQLHRKTRRCWSPELHRRFLQALQQLGGSHAATPKQIRDLMKVDGLTNDEVKSHLQKYRLHTRRPSPAVQSSSSSSPQAPQFVVVGGIWVPPPDYAAAAAAVAAAAQPVDSPCAPPGGIYAPVASLPSDFRFHQKQQNKKQSHGSPTGPLQSEGICSGEDNSIGDDDATNSASPASSSSSQTTTVSPPL